NDAHLSAGKGDERDYEDRKEEEETLHDRILRQDSAKAGGLGWQEGREETQWIEAALALPFLPSCLESDFESELEFPLLVSRRRRELIRVIRNRAGGVSVDVGGHDRGEGRPLLGVERGPQLGDDLRASRAGNRHEARVAKVDVIAIRQIQRVAGDAKRPIALHTVAVQVDVRADIDRQAAVQLEQDADLVAVEQRADDAVRGA